MSFGRFKEWIGWIFSWIQGLDADGSISGRRGCFRGHDHGVSRFELVMTSTCKVKKRWRHSRPGCMSVIYQLFKSQSNREFLYFLNVIEIIGLSFLKSLKWYCLDLCHCKSGRFLILRKWFAQVGWLNPSAVLIQIIPLDLCSGLGRQRRSRLLMEAEAEAAPGTDILQNQAWIFHHGIKTFMNT